MTNEEIARVAHEINRAYCLGIGDPSHLAWEEAPEWQRASTLKGVAFLLKNPDAGVWRIHGEWLKEKQATGLLKNPDAEVWRIHSEWLKEKQATGWKYGPVTNPKTKEHPCCLPYDLLPGLQKVKDFLFLGVVQALRPYLTE
jgi:hypothetical protein